MTDIRPVAQDNLSYFIHKLRPTFGWTDDKIRAAFDQFYAEAYPDLAPLTHAAPLAAQVVQAVRDANLDVVIATNPLYPESAIRQRMAWAGISTDFNDYAFVTTADVMHFAKPQPAYYGEILARTGLEPDEVLMVGDHPINDMQAASAIGMHTLHADHSQLERVLEALPNLAQRAVLPITPAAIIPQWLGNLGALFGVAHDVPVSHWPQQPFEGEWSPLQIICHLYDYELLVHRARLERIRDEVNPFIADSPRPPGASEMLACAEDGMSALRLFSEARMQTIELVSALTEAQWMRPARHSIFGPTTLTEMAYFTAQHDRLHIRQLCQTLRRCELEEL
jgi:phosphoglycolate phosphatase-like HAD superfamily hydrolase